MKKVILMGNVNHVIQERQLKKVVGNKKRRIYLDYLVNNQIKIIEQIKKVIEIRELELKGRGV